MNRPRRTWLAAAAACSLAVAAQVAGPAALADAHPGSAGHHVLLISVDGLHQSDLDAYVRTHPDSALAALARRAAVFSQARTPGPSDSFPGILALTTGGSPKSTGVFYDDSYDRTLAAPGSNCAAPGTEVVFDEGVDRNPDALDAGGGIDPAALPRDPAHGCAPVYPHQYLKVNTVFEVARAAGLRTAWSDKHPAYDLLNGPSGQGVQDLYTPEIASTDGTTAGTEAYDDLKVAAVRDEIAGRDHTGAHQVGVPAVFGLNFQAVSVTQKLPSGGYQADGTPSPALAGALDHTDASIGALVHDLAARGLDRDTEVIVTAKHGQSPIDRASLRFVDKKLIVTAVNAVAPNLVAQQTADDVSLLWLTDQSKTAAAVAALRAHADELGIDRVISGDELADRFGDPTRDARTPDIIIQPKHGVIYTKPGKKIAEHGGLDDQDRHVALLVAQPGRPAVTIPAPVSTAQVAPTILDYLGLDADRLQAVRAEHTRSLPTER